MAESSRTDATPSSPADPPAAERLQAALERHLSPILARSVLKWVCIRRGVARTELQDEHLVGLGELLGRSLYLKPDEAREVERALRGSAGSGLRPTLAPPSSRADQAAPSSAALAQVAIESEADIVRARSETKRVAEAFGFGATEVTRITTVVSELARNIHQYAGSGLVILRAVRLPDAGLEIEAIDAGPGIRNVDAIFSGRYESKTGLGLGLRGSARLMDSFRVDSPPGGGTRVVARRYRRAALR